MVQLMDLRHGSNFLGRDASNDFVIDDSTVSGRHCEIIVDDFSVRVRDLGSTNGTYLDGELVLEGVIADGQCLSLGTAGMRLDSPPVRIEIPAPAGVLPPAPPVLADGRAGCVNHPPILAGFRCLKCERTYCSDCVKVLRLVGGNARYSCDICGGACEPLLPPAEPKPKSFGSRLLDTIRLHKVPASSKNRQARTD